MTTPTAPRKLARAALALGLAAGLLAGAVPASARTFTFRGGGWGHGIGMSQYGALGLSKRGWGAPRIIKWYYRGAGVTTKAPPKGSYRVGLLQNRKTITVTVTSGSATLQTQSGTAIETVPAGKTRTITVTSDQKYRVKKGNGQQVGGLWGGPGDPLEVRPDGVVRVTEWGHSAGRGFLAFPTAGSGRGHLVAVVDAEQYLYGLGEVPSSWPAAVLAAQAIAGRTYAYRTVVAGRGGCACDILGDTRDQAYTGWDKEAGTAGDRWVKAVDSSKRQVAVFGGELITTYYSSSSGGYTENIENVWTAAQPQPYLRGRCDPGDFVSANPNRVWSVSFGAKELAKRLGRPNGMAKVLRFDVLERGVSGRIVRLTIHGRKGNGALTAVTMDGWNLRRTLGLKETRFWINQNRNVVGGIRARYDNMRCRPGLATSNQKKLGGGRWQKFERGRLFLAPSAGKARWIRGPVLGRYLELRGPKGRLGWPTTDVRKLKKGKLRAVFQDGVITCRKSGACRVRFR